MQVNLTNKQLEELLIKQSFVTQEDIEEAHKETKNTSLSSVDYFLSQKILTPDLLGQAIAEYYKVEYADLNSHVPARETVLEIPEATARKWRIVIFSQDKKQTKVVTDNPLQKGLKEALKKIFPTTKTIVIMYGLSQDIDAAFIHYRKALDTRFGDIIKDSQRVAPEIVDEIIKDAMELQASDIHFEPYEQDALIRFRIDGVLQEAGRIPKTYYDNILNRIKILSKLKIDEHGAAQDGAIRFVKDKIHIDLRVSIVPSVTGEKVVIRVLSEYVRGFNLTDLGLSDENQVKIEEAAKKPFGMIIVSGATGSGKTTTLYSLLKLRNTPEVNIMTIEDPVEYRIEGATQVQVNPDKKLTFSKGLKSLVRQDPDIILVGEIRDTETAEIAVNAALTGHLLFSTFHANDAATTIPRLLDMGVEPFLLSSTLELVVSQRLVRKICEECRISYEVKSKKLIKDYPTLENILTEEDMTLYKSKGCDACGQIGYKGRTALTEVIEMTPEMRELILTKPSKKQIITLANTQGYKSLFADGMDKVKQGATTLEELVRVVSPD